KYRSDDSKKQGRKPALFLFYPLSDSFYCRLGQPQHKRLCFFQGIEEISFPDEIIYENPFPAVLIDLADILSLGIIARIKVVCAVM
ncbi:MAG: hypothetical protein J6A79_06750, partial [Clostridia bacterium]|nr:hypothetical protein [Clostridia bacterium]